ncbi:hypothetical protein ES703_39341 [subsurface metagenome]
MQFKKAVEVLEHWINTGDMPPDPQDFKHAVFLGALMLQCGVALEDWALVEGQRLAGIASGRG